MLSGGCEETASAAFMCSAQVRCFLCLLQQKVCVVDVPMCYCPVGPMYASKQKFASTYCPNPYASHCSLHKVHAVLPSNSFDSFFLIKSIKVSTSN